VKISKTDIKSTYYPLNITKTQNSLNTYWKMAISSEGSLTLWKCCGAVKRQYKQT
jgi:hypothetical protein